MSSKAIWLVVVIILIIGAIYFLEQQKVDVSQVGQEQGSSQVQNTQPTLPSSPVLSKVDQARIEKKESQYPKAPELTGITGYLNGAQEGLQISDFKGKVVLIDFWTYTCINCIRTLPHLVEWDKKYRDDGLVVIGVHTPEFDFEKVAQNVEEAIKKYGIDYRVVQDNDYQTWRAFKNRYWPRKYLIDADGFIRYDHIGEGGYDATEKMIKQLLEEAGNQVEEEDSNLVDSSPTSPTTPELYAGYNFAIPRGQNIGNKGGLQPEETVSYTLPDQVSEDKIYLEGLWISNADNAQSKQDGASIILDYTANAVNIVADAPTPLMLEVMIDDKYVTQEMAGKDVIFQNEKAYVLIDKPLLYNVVNGDYEQHTLKLIAQIGFSFNAFTFG